MEEKKVYELDLHGRGLKMLPEDLKKLKSVRVLDASCNAIAVLKGLSENKELRELKLYGNHIEVLDGLEKLKELNTLLLQYNKISSIGNGLKSCTKLHILRLDHNLLETVRVRDLSSCSANLSSLDLSFNRLTSVEGLEALASLAELNLESNRLESVPNLSHCRKLIELNLSGNPLQTHHLSNLKALQLKTLKLGSVGLSTISMLPRLSQLQDLHLPGNALSSVDNCHSLFPSLELLNLQGNCLGAVQALASLAMLESLMELQVKDNPLCSSSENYRADVTKLLPKLEMLDGVALLSGGVAVEPSRVPLMRPLTPSTVGPSLRQVERQLAEIETQLSNSSSKIEARFKQLLSQGAEPARAARGTVDQDSTSRTSTQDQDSNSNSSIQDQDGKCRTSQNQDSINRTSTQDQDGKKDVEVEGDICLVPSQENGPKRPSTQSGRRARLQEALLYATQSMQQQST